MAIDTSRATEPENPHRMALARLRQLREEAESLEGFVEREENYLDMENEEAKRLRIQLRDLLNPIVRTTEEALREYTVAGDQWSAARVSAAGDEALRDVGRALGDIYTPLEAIAQMSEPASHIGQEKGKRASSYLRLTALLEDLGQGIPQSTLRIPPRGPGAEDEERRLLREARAAAIGERIAGSARDHARLASEERSALYGPLGRLEDPERLAAQEDLVLAYGSWDIGGDLGAVEGALRRRSEYLGNEEISLARRRLEAARSHLRNVLPGIREGIFHETMETLSQLEGGILHAGPPPTLNAQRLESIGRVTRAYRNLSSHAVRELLGDRKGDLDGIDQRVRTAEETAEFYNRWGGRLLEAAQLATQPSPLLGRIRDIAIIYGENDKGMFTLPSYRNAARGSSLANAEAVRIALLSRMKGELRSRTEEVQRLAERALQDATAPQEPADIYALRSFADEAAAHSRRSSHSFYRDISTLGEFKLLQESLASLDRTRDLFAGAETTIRGLRGGTYADLLATYTRASRDLGNLAAQGKFEVPEATRDMLQQRLAASLVSLAGSVRPDTTRSAEGSALESILRIAQTRGIDASSVRARWETHAFNPQRQAYVLDGAALYAPGLLEGMLAEGHLVVLPLGMLSSALTGDDNPATRERVRYLRRMIAEERRDPSGMPGLTRFGDQVYVFDLEGFAAAPGVRYGRSVPEGAGAQVLEAARLLADEFPDMPPLTVLTADPIVLLRAGNYEGVRVRQLPSTIAEMNLDEYDGTRRIILPASLYADALRAGSATPSLMRRIEEFALDQRTAVDNARMPLLAEEIVIALPPDGDPGESIVLRYSCGRLGPLRAVPEAARLFPLRYLKERGTLIEGSAVQPRNPEQLGAMDLLLDGSFRAVLLEGASGSGATLLAAAMGGLYANRTGTDAHFITPQAYEGKSPLLEDLASATGAAFSSLRVLHPSEVPGRTLQGCGVVDDCHRYSSPSGAQLIGSFASDSRILVTAGHSDSAAEHARLTVLRGAMSNADGVVRYRLSEGVRNPRLGAVVGRLRGYSRLQ